MFMIISPVHYVLQEGQKVYNAKKKKKTHLIQQNQASWNTHLLAPNTTVCYAGYDQH